MAQEPIAAPPQEAGRSTVPLLGPSKAKSGRRALESRRDETDETSLAGTDAVRVGQTGQGWFSWVSCHGRWIGCRH